MEPSTGIRPSREPWNKGKLAGQKASLKLKDIWAIRVRLQIKDRSHDLALFDLAIDSTLRACDLVKVRVRDIDGQRISGPSNCSWGIPSSKALCAIWELKLMTLLRCRTDGCVNLAAGQRPQYGR